jgi:hypothetical protein
LKVKNLFHCRNDMRLKLGSPAINSGIVTDYTPSTDVVGTARDGQIDRGAYEFGAVSPFFNAGSSRALPDIVNQTYLPAGLPTPTPPPGDLRPRAPVNLTVQ